jgi:hypothetical protein
MSTYSIDLQTLSIGLLLVRVVIGLIMAAAFGLALTGFGEYSLDALFGVAGRWSAGFTWIVLVLGVAGGFVNLALRRRPAVTAQA